ncbi:MAG TPA: ECF-type sigma factor, partial [Pyrinomonadaceae bacterium]|nr:ECF-type sigma factor [Pyrinomonadaceae bacterium]
MSTTLSRSKILLLGKRTTSINAEINAAGRTSGYIICRDSPAKVDMPQTHQITDLLRAWSKGDSEALAKLMPLVNRELKKIAHAYMRNERPGHILQTTALVDEVLMRLIPAEKINWNSRKQFYALIAYRMRQILVEYARIQITGGGTRIAQVGISGADQLTDKASEEV